MEQEFEKLTANPKTKFFETGDKSCEKIRNQCTFNSRTGRGTSKAGSLIPETDSEAGPSNPASRVFMALPRSNVKWNPTVFCRTMESCESVSEPGVPRITRMRMRARALV